MSEQEREKWVDATAVAEHLGVSADWVYGKAAKGKIPSHKIGGHRKFLLSEIDDWARSGAGASVNEPTPIRR